MIHNETLSAIRARIHCLIAGLGVVLSLIMPNALFGVEIENMYQASLLVNSRDDVRERQQAFSKAMHEVLLKVSGRTEPLTSNAIRRALNSPEPYVDSYLYRTIGEPDDQSASLPATPSSAPTLPLEKEVIELEVSFFESEILRLLDDNNIPLWPSNRPSTLLWVVVQDELAEREILSSANIGSSELLTLISDSAMHRGLPLLYPLMDLEDRRALGTDDLWNLNEEMIKQASQRYQAESILALRLYKSLSGELLGKSLYLFRDRALEYTSYEEELSLFVETAINMSIEELSSYYAVLISGSSSAIVVNLKVDGINTAKDYADLLKYVDGLTDVSSFQINSVEQTSINLALSTGGQLRQLVETIALEGALEPVVELQRTNNEVTMRYLWKEQR